MDPIAVTASIISLTRFLLEQIERHKAGDISDDDLNAMWTDLQVQRTATKSLWQDAKLRGGYRGGTA